MKRLWRRVGCILVFSIAVKVCIVIETKQLNERLRKAQISGGDNM